MKFAFAPAPFSLTGSASTVEMILYGYPSHKEQGGVGAALFETIRKRKFDSAVRAWDLLSIALAVVSADLAGHRSKSPDGWTREFNITVAVVEPDFWASQATVLQSLLQFLTTDRWTVTFAPGGATPPKPAKPIYPEEDCVTLLSGGLDSFIGAVDLVAGGAKPFAISQSVRGDDVKQREICAAIGAMRHLQLNHNARPPKPEIPPSQRGRSIAFFAYGILAATTLKKYHDGAVVTLHVCENGFITINPPLTAARLGSLSTRTSHPVVLSLLQRLLDAANLRVNIASPYRFHTKGEMLASCKNQPLLTTFAHRTTSCGRFKRFGYKHCGRCVPCLIRRAAFQAWGVADKTSYVYGNLAIDDKEHARFDDVRSATMAIAQVADDGFDSWFGASASASELATDAMAIRSVVQRGLAELDSLLKTFKTQ